MGSRIISSLLRYRAWVLISTVILLIIAGTNAFFITKNTSPYFIGLDHPTRQHESQLRESFTRAGDNMVILVSLGQRSIFDNDSVALLQGLHDSIESIHLLESFDSEQLLPYIDTKQQLLLTKVEKDIHGGEASDIAERETATSSAVRLANELRPQIPANDYLLSIGQYVFPIRSVKSLLNTDNIFEFDDELFVEPSYVPQEGNQWSNKTKSDILDNSLLTGSFVSHDGSAFALHIELDIDTEDGAVNALLVNKIKHAVKTSIDIYKEGLSTHDKQAQTPQVHYAGVPVVNVALSEVMEADNAKYFPLVIALVLALLYLAFRSPWAALYGLLIAVCSIVLSFGLMPPLGITLNIITTILPVFIITVAVTDAIHVMADAGQRNPLRTNHEQLSHTLNKLFRPMFITSITTGVGFYSLSFTEINNIHDFGIMVAISVVIAFVLSITLLPVLLSYRPLNIKQSTKPRLNLAPITHTLSKQNGVTLFVCLLFVTGMAFAIQALQVDQASIESFGTDTQLRQDNQAFKDQGIGSVPLSIWIEGNDSESILSKGSLQLIARINALTATHPEVTDSASLLDFLERTHDVLMPDSDTLDLNNGELVRQYLFLLEGSRERDLEALVSVGPYDQTRIILSLHNDSSADIESLIHDIDQAIEGHIPQGLTLSYSSYGAVAVAAANEVVESQVNSMLISIALILAVLTIVFRSVISGLIAILPLCFTLVAMFGLMGLLDYPLDIGSAVIAGIAFGIGIDYSIHFIEAIKRSYQCNNARLGIQQALNEVVMPISVSALVIAAGFSLLMISSFQPIANLGLLISLTMLLSAALALVILPALLQVGESWLYHRVGKPANLAPIAGEDVEIDEPILLEEKLPQQTTSKVLQPEKPGLEAQSREPA